MDPPTPAGLQLVDGGEGAIPTEATIEIEPADLLLGREDQVAARKRGRAALAGKRKGPAPCAGGIEPGDLVIIGNGEQALLVRVVKNETVIGYLVGGGSDGYPHRTARGEIRGVMVKRSKALDTALAYRHGTKAKGPGDSKWRNLMRVALAAATPAEGPG
jgi:hypothetical protein